MTTDTQVQKNGTDGVNGTNGTNGHTANGHTNGHTNGHANGHTNGSKNEAFVDGSVAVSPNTPDLVPEILEKIAASGKAFTSSDPKSRTELLDAARSLVYAVETPREAMIRFCWSQV